MGGARKPPVLPRPAPGGGEPLPCRPARGISTLSGMRICECRERDVELLDLHLPARPADSAHEARFARHRAGVGTLLVAWFDGVPVGSCEVRWEGCVSPEVRAAHPECPEISGLGLWPGTRRSERAGRALIHRAEQLSRGRGHGLVGLGITRNNPRAEELCRGLGYRPSVSYLDCGSYQDGDGMDHRVADACLFLVKDLTATAPETPQP